MGPKLSGIFLAGVSFGFWVQRFSPFMSQKPILTPPPIRHLNGCGGFSPADLRIVFYNHSLILQLLFSAAFNIKCLCWIKVFTALISKIFVLQDNR